MNMGGNRVGGGGGGVSGERISKRRCSHEGSVRDQGHPPAIPPSPTCVALNMAVV